MKKSYTYSQEKYKSTVKRSQNVVGRLENRRSARLQADGSLRSQEEVISRRLEQEDLDEAGVINERGAEIEFSL